MNNCPNCGANAFVYKNGAKYCEFCNTRFELEESEKPKKKSEISLESDVERLLRKCEEEPFKAKKYAGLILDIDPTNKEALKYL